MNIPKILSIIRPQAEWVLQGDTYRGLEWLDKTQIKPSFQEIIDGDALVQKLVYMELRKPLYPPIEDQLDAIWKGGEAFDAMQKQILAVKELYPKI